jgi:uncharacterized protein (DUF305 family)
MMRYLMIAAIAAFGVTAAIAQSHHGHHGGHGTAATSAEGEATRAYREANAAMHEAMNVPYSGNADVDFVRGMIPHHEGAVAMAKIVLAHGKDPEVRKLAEAVIRTQTEEIAWMKEWLKKNGG